MTCVPERTGFAHSAPEIFKGGLYDETVDVYSFGLVLLGVAVKEGVVEFTRRRFMGDRGKAKAPPVNTVVREMMGGWRPVTAAHPVAFAPPPVNDLIVRCCAQDPAERPSFAEVQTYQAL